ncbi:MAG: hypothetical protein AAGK14_06655 [Verrucomicrobiota bacterium]
MLFSLFRSLLALAPSRLASGAFCLCLLPGLLQAGEEKDVIWIGLIKANASPPTSNPILKQMEPRLKAVFGYQAYHLMQEDTVPIGQNWNNWIMPSHEYYMKIIPMENDGEGNTRIHFELYQKDTELCMGTIVLNRQRPTFIAGPHTNTGKLIFVLRRCASSAPIAGRD